METQRNHISRPVKDCRPFNLLHGLRIACRGPKKAYIAALGLESYSQLSQLEQGTAGAFTQAQAEAHYKASIHAIREAIHNPRAPQQQTILRWGMIELGELLEQGLGADEDPVLLQDIRSIIKVCLDVLPETRMQKKARRKKEKENGGI